MSRALIYTAAIMLLAFQPVACFGQGAADAGKPTMKYPLAAAVSGDSTYVVDLDLPGVWKVTGEASEVFVAGSKRLREPLNRPRCIAVTPDGDFLVGDTASRDVYLVSQDGGQPKPLTDGNVGIPMSLAISADKQVYVADLETRFILRFPLAGGKVETFAKINTRGLAFDKDGVLWAVTQEKDQLVKFDDSGEAVPVIEGHPFDFPHNVAIDESGTAYVSDGYSKAIWVLQAGAKEAVKLVEGDPLKNPVGLLLDGGSALVADPHAKQLFKVDLQSKEISPTL